MPDFSFVILSYNEEVHLPRLLKSIQGLNAAVYVLDSGSTDRTLEICKEFGVIVQQHAFENHPKQWHAALNSFPVDRIRHLKTFHFLIVLPAVIPEQAGILV